MNDKPMKKLLSIIVFCFSVCAFAETDGTCTLVTNSDGTFRIVCTGDGVIHEYESVTNEVTITQVRNCEALRHDLESVTNELSSLLEDAHYGVFGLPYILIQLEDDYNNVSPYLQFNSDDPYVSMSFSNIPYLISDARSQSEDLITLEENLEAQMQALSATVQNIECCGSSSPDDNGSQCCQTDFTPIIDKLNNIIEYYHYITNKTSAIYEQLGGSSHLGYNYIDSNYHLNRNAGLRFFNWNSSKTPYINLLNLALHSQYNNAFGLASANNYLHKLTFLETPYISTNLETLVNQSTNFFSFFRGEVGVHGVLEDWQPEFGSYYNYLTNHYLKSIIDPSSLSTSEQSKTNWFSRIETLLAALVFADSDTATNTVDLSYGRDQISELTSGLQSIDQTSYDQLNLFHQTSESLISRVRSFSSAFSNASMPSTVRLVKLGNSDSSYIQFESSEFSPLVEACHCATTLAWCLGGLILLFWFIHYTVKASYNLVVFVYSVISSIFSK